MKTRYPIPTVAQVREYLDQFPPDMLVCEDDADIGMLADENDLENEDVDAVLISNMFSEFRR